MHQSRISASVTRAGGKQLSSSFDTCSAEVRPASWQRLKPQLVTRNPRYPLILRCRRAGRYSRPPMRSRLGRPSDEAHAKAAGGFFLMVLIMADFGAVSAAVPGSAPEPHETAPAR